MRTNAPKEKSTVAIARGQSDSFQLGAPHNRGAAVSETIKSPGRILDQFTRKGMESSFGHDFSLVRVHTDAADATSVGFVDAVAYTVGNHIAFGANRYCPYSSKGQALLAHELTHVVQQQGHEPNSVPLMVDSDHTLESEAEHIEARVLHGLAFEPPRERSAPTIQRQRAGTGPSLGNFQLQEPPPVPLFLPGQVREAFVLPAPPAITLTPPSFVAPSSPTPLTPVPRLQGPNFAPVTIIPVLRCVPDTPLTWADFQGTPPAGTFSAQTNFTVSPAVVQGNAMFQAKMIKNKSWVRAQFKQPSNRATNGCTTAIQQCKRSIAANRGGTWSFSGTPSTACPASIVPDATVVATTVAECDSLIGAECDRTAQLESLRLLAHEQGHFDIACVFSNKANDALIAGGTQSAISAAVNTKLSQTTTDYDNDTQHGCDAGNQASWTADISAGLSSVTIP